jgi:hypothetical protein
MKANLGIVENDSRSGTTLVVVVILSAIASFAIGASLTAMGTYMRHSRNVFRHERALMLADAGIKAAIVELRNGGDGTIDAENARNMFSYRSLLNDETWQFRTEAVSVGGADMQITSIGQVGGMTATVSARASRNVTIDTIHSLYMLALYAGNSSGDTNYTLSIGGTGTGADFVDGDVHVNGHIDVTGTASLRLPEFFVDENGDGQWNEGEAYTHSGTAGNYPNGMTAAEYNAYVAARDPSLFYSNGMRDPTEPFIDSIGNGIYDSGESYVDVDGDGQFGFGDSFTDSNGDGIYTPGEAFVDRGNGQYDVGEAFQDLNGNGVWDAATSGRSDGWGGWTPGTDEEPYEDVGNGVYDEGEAFVDLNGVYDEGETYLDDRNGFYDYGTSASGDISGLPSPGEGQLPANNGANEITPPDLDSMYYENTKAGSAPTGASDDWGHDVDVASGAFNSYGKILNSDDPRHIFVKNPSWNYASSKNIGGRNDYFLEDPTDPSYGNSSQFLNVKDNGNDKVYYVDGNLYIHNPNTYDFMFRNPGVRITIVAKGNITISDEFWYNGGASGPQDALALIAMKDDGNASDGGGNIYLGDSVYGTGGDIHAMLYAENDFVDNNLNTAGQPYLSVFGNMSAGNHIDLYRSGSGRTRLDVTMDDRIRSRIDVPPGLPPALMGERSISSATDWGLVKGSWESHARLL